MSEHSKEIDWRKTLEAALLLPSKAGAQYTAFYNYSILNQARLLEQGVYEPVANWSRWNELGRHILKGAQPKEVVHPKIIKVENKQTGEQEERLVGFSPRRTAYGYSDTGGKELVIPEPPEWNLLRMLGKLGITMVPFEGLNGNRQGHSRGQTMAINPVAKYPLGTAIHEAGHIVSGHTTPENLAKYEEHRGVYEFVAEGISYLVRNELGVLDAEQAESSRGYMQSWMDGEHPPDAAYRQVFGGAEKVLRAGRLAPAIGHSALQGSIEHQND